MASWPRLVNASLTTPEYSQATSTFIIKIIGGRANTPGILWHGKYPWRKACACGDDGELSSVDAYGVSVCTLSIGWLYAHRLGVRESPLTVSKYHRSTSCVGNW